jgi:VCBS repeat-containing protein
MAMTYEQAIAALSDPQYQTIDGLRFLVSQISVQVPNAVNGAVTLLYSGTVGGDIPAWQIAEQLAGQINSPSGSQVITIGDTPVADFLKSDAFMAALHHLTGDEGFNAAYDGTINPDGTRTPGMWDIASKNLAEAATGDVRTIVPFAESGKVFAATELPALLNNPNVTHIDGIPKDYYQRMMTDAIGKGLTEAQALEHVRATVSAISLNNTATLQFSLDADGNISRNTLGELDTIGTGIFFNGTAIDGTQLPDAIPHTYGGSIMAGAIHSGQIPNADIDSLSKVQAGIEQLKKYAALDNAGSLLNKLGLIGDIIGLALVASAANAAYAAGDTDGAQQILKDWALEYAGGLAGGIAAAQLVSSLLAPIYLTGPAGAIIAGGLSLMAGILGGIGGELLAHSINDFFISARNWIQRRDPLTLDLDGDGLETVGIDSNSPILFDHDGDGVANATGWIKPDDGFLVLDRNGNGVIDNGAELFGDSTPLAAGSTAADGFAALAQEDTNGDGLVNADDANWNDLRIWRDLNSDGVSQDGELFTFEALGIAGIHVAKSENTTRLADGNQIADLGSYIRTDGTEGAVGQVTGALADIDLVDNPFYREFSDTIPLTEQAQALPDMQGSGSLRDLREAVSLSPILGSALAGYAAADTKAGQLALIDALISQWALSSGFQTSIEKAAAQDDRLLFLVPGLTAGAVLGGGFVSSDGGSGGGSILGVPSAEERARLEALKAQQIRITEILGILEKFNGMTFVNIEPDVVHTGANLSIAPADTSTAGATYSLGLGDLFVLTLSSAQISFIEQAYAALRQSVYDGLLLQTRLKPYMDAVNLTITEAGIGLDFTGTTTLFQTRYDQAPGEALRDLLDLQRIAGTNLNGSGWKGYEQLRGWLTDAVNSADTALSAKLIAALTEFGYSDLRTQGDGATANDVVIGTETGAVLHGEGGNDLILGGAGDDVLNGGTGTDTLYGSMGNDTYVFNLGEGTDTIIEMNGDTGTDTLQFGAGIRAGDLDIFMDGDKLVFAHINGKDRLSVANWFGSLVDGAHRLDTVTFADGAVLQLDALQLGSGGNDTLIGTSNSDILMGGAGDDILISDGNDWLNGGSGADTMAGSIGDDIYVVDNPGDIVIELEGEGNDTIDARISYTLGGNVENMRLMGASSINGTGNELDNVITGNAADNLLSGMDGSDTLIGNAGNDTLDGGLGADIMMGGTGNDVYIVDTLTDTVTEQAGQGIDTVKTDLGYTLGSNLENLILTGINGVDGTGNELDNVLTGNAADNTLSGLAGNDTLDGGLGADTLLGGKGDDIYIVDSTGDLVDENAGEGIDTVKSSITYTLTDQVENLTLTGTTAIDGTGNLLDNIIIGNSGSNLLTGLEGNDTLDGKGGADILIGGTGDDIYVVDDIGDVVLENADEGIDTVQSSIGYTLGAHLENLTLIGGSAFDGTGNELDNILIGNGAANILEGGLGEDAMAGGHGNDTYILDDLGDAVTEYAGQGTDTVVSPFDYTLGANVENLVLTEGVALNGTGNGLDNVLTGNSNDNTLIGLGGNDTLDGGLGADTLIGGLGDDTYIVDNPLDTTLEAAGEGIDTVKSNLTWVLGDNLDNLTLTGVAAVDGTGNALDNVILGNASDNTLIGLEGNDTLDGGAGADVMLSGTGNDIYVVDNAGDEVVEYLDEGRDLVKSSISYTLTDNVENLTLTGTADLDGTGNGLDNVILGNSGNNILMGLEGNDTLDGGKGADTLLGGLGDDMYIVDNAGDAVIENVGEGIDHFQSSVTYTLTDNVENLTLTGTAAINGTGNALDNVILGASGNNVLDGGAGADMLAGGAGNDTYIVDNTADAVIELIGEGTDSVFASVDYTLSDNVENLTLTGAANINATGNGLNNTLTGNAADNLLSGMEGNDTLIGGAGNDLLDGGLGADVMMGGIGNDIYVVDNIGDVVTENLDEGTDTVQSSISYTLTDNVENLALTGMSAIDGTGNVLNNIITANDSGNMLSGLEGDDTLIGGIGNDTLDGGLGADAMSGGAGNDSYILDDIGDVITEYIDEGMDTVQSSINYTLTDNVENLILTGEHLDGTGNALDNSITGTSGNNILDGGAGADTLAGGAGNDTYIVDHPADVVIELAGEGTDSVFASVDYVLSDNVENLILIGTAGINGTGNALDNLITGNGADNTLNGMAGDDTLDGGAGVDTLIGDVGNDIYYVDNTADVIVENFNEGMDSAFASATYTLSDNIENLTLTGTAGIDGTGNALDNIILGNSGANVLDGGAGADTMTGGAGNDTYIVDNAGDRTIEAFNSGIDTVFSSVSYILASNVENLTLTGAGNIDATGNELNNILVGNTGNNRLYGMAGNDTLTGEIGNDLLDGGVDADTMAGNAGDDTYFVDNVSDVVVENVDEGIDTVQSSITYTLGANAENLTLTGSAANNGTGNGHDNVIIGNAGNNVLSGLDGNDTLTGNAGNDILDGGLGADVMMGGIGNDIYVVDNVGDSVTEALNAGTDLVQSSITYTLTDNVENLTLTGANMIDGTGNTLNNIIIGNAAANVINGGAGTDTLSAGAGDDTLIGGDGNDALSGEAGNDLLQGESGNDTLNGGLGADIMLGGVGNDIYGVDNSGDLVIENLDEGIDLVQSGITYTLTDNVENLTLTGTAAINGTGNALDNVILGNSGANVLTGLEGNDTLNGGAGADVMLGGTGNDTYVVDNIGDVATENLDEGIDNVQSSVTYALTDNIENLTLTGGAAINGTGNALHNVIVGNAAANVLNGGLGADNMSGGAGNDTYVVDNAGDIVTEALNAGTDLVQSSITYTLTANVENLTLTGLSAINGTGNTLNNIIIGNAAVNVIDGGLGADSLYAGAGDDILIGGAGNDLLDGGAGADAMAGGLNDDTYVVDNIVDTVAEALNEGIDLVQSSITYTLTDNVENLTLTGTVNIDGTGNALDNTIIGNSAANVLNGGQGADTMQGGAGSDTYIVDSIGDIVIEGVDAGTDTVRSGVTYMLSDNVENLTLTGTAAINGTGNALDNIITGNGGVNILAGQGGNDTYYIDNTADVIVENTGEGTDSVFAAATYTLSENVENLTLTGTAAINATGNALDNIITGNSGANLLDGGVGADTMAGGAGDDMYIVDNAGDMVIETLNAGTDTVQSSISYTLIDNLENLVLTGIDAINATGNALNNTITGNAANNLIDGGIGVDAMAGGAGDDTYVVDNVDDVVVEAVNAGTDTVLASVSYALASNIENLNLGGAANISGTGNALDNLIVGNSGNNTLMGMEGNDTLDGGAGADVMDGGLGDDTYVVDSTDDVVMEAANAGNDTIQSSVSYTLSGHVESLTLIGTTDINAAGNTLDNILTGNSGANVLDGGAGADILIGGQGNDTLLGGAGNDRYVFNPADGADIIIDALGSDTLYIGGNLIEANLEGLRDGDNMIVTIFGTTETITLTNWFVQSEGVNRIEFSDDSSLDRIGIEGLLNRPPVANPDAITVFEDGGVLNMPTEALLANDTDPNVNDVISVVAVGASAIGASVSLAGGYVQYDIGNRFQELWAGQTVTDSFGYTISDSKGETASSVVNVTITGVNDAPVTATDVAAVQEDLTLVASGNVLDNDTDVDQGTVLIVADGGLFTGSYGSLILAADGSYNYTLDNSSLAVQSLAAGQVVTEVFAYQATDGLVATPSALIITITGTNDAQVTAADTVTVQEDLIVSATGNVLSNDTDIDQGTVLSVVDAGFRAGNYGNLALGADGSYAYTVDNTSTMVQSLGRTAQLSEHFGYTVTDGIVGVASALDVYLNGTNDAPILVAPLADQDITFNKSFSWQMPSGSFIDIDQGDALDYSATLADGSPLPDWLSFDPITRTFSGMAPKTVGYVDIQVTATDRVSATGSTIDSLTATDVFRISISHGNEGVGNGQDSAPAGTDSNFNDGPGTSPGNPGAGGGYSAGNILLGTEGNDNLTGSSGDDLFDSRGSNDRLEGGAGNDIYLFGRNGGVDTVIEKDATAGNTDVLRFGDNIASEQAWFRRVGSDLEVSFIGTDDRAIVNKWYKGSAYHLEQFQTADGKMLLDSQVENLVSAMAAFSPPAAGQTTLPQNYQDALAPVLAANWK